MEESLRIVCPACKTVYRPRPGTAPGARVRCGRCGGEVVVPEPQASSTVMGQATLAGSPDDHQVTLPLPAATAPTLTREGAEAEVSVEDALASAGPGTARYVEQGAIGHGGMGEVVLCVDRDIRRPVAMKRMLPATAGDPARRARFIEEAQVTGQLEHPNIVPVYELTRQPDGSVYYTMKLVKGRSLAEILKELRAGEPPFEKGGFPRTPSPKPSGPATQKSLERGAGENLSTERFSPAFSLSDLLQVFLKVCDGVAFAHSRGVIHRDLKPANIMVGDYGEVLVMDWGLAKILPPEGSNTFGRVRPTPAPGKQDYPPEGIGTFGREGVVSDRQDAAALHTMAGSMMGSPGYMSPEQAKGELDRMDQRSDTFSLGAILYEILTLERAIGGDTAYAILANTLKGNIVPPEQRAPNRNVPRELSAIAMKCLHKGRAHRYRSVLDLKRDLTLFLEGRSVSAAPDTFAQAFVKLIKRNKGVSAAIAASAVVLLAVGVFSYVRIVSALDRAVVGEARAKTNEQAAVTAQQQQRATALAASERFAKQAALAAENYRWAEAGERLGDAQAVCPDGPWAPYARGRLAQIKGDHEGAIKLFDAALKIAPGQREIVSARDKSASLLQRVAEARKAMKEGGKLANWQVAEKMGDTFDQVENWREAAQAYAQALQLLPPNVPREDLEDKLGNARAWIACEGFWESIRDLPAPEQAKRVWAKSSEIHGRPFQSSGSGFYHYEGGKLVGLSYGLPNVQYVQAVEGLSLRELIVTSSRLYDLRPLKGMPVEHLSISGTCVHDLDPLRGMRLKHLNLSATRVVDLGPLQGMPLVELDCNSCRGLTDLSPLKGAPIQKLGLNGTRVSDLSPLRGMPLEELSLGGTPVRELAPLKGMLLSKLNLEGTLVADLTPLHGMPLRWLRLYQGTLGSDLNFQFSCEQCSGWKQKVLAVRCRVLGVDGHEGAGGGGQSVAMAERCCRMASTKRVALARASSAFARGRSWLTL